MKKSIIAFCAIATLTAGCATKRVHWGYSGHEGPQNWSTLSPDNYACSGNNQSPINLTRFVEADLTPIKFNYQVGGNEIVNNGHTVQLNYQAGSNIDIDETSFKLLQFHFHAPSENNINNESFPLEAHLVHADSNGNLAVVAVMFKEGDANKGLEAAWKKMPKHVGDKHQFANKIDVNDILPVCRKYYRFSGSLTTPPCSEGVRWLVMKEVLTASKQQIKAFSEVIHEPNNRPLQPINARTVLN